MKNNNLFIFTGAFFLRISDRGYKAEIIDKSYTFITFKITALKESVGGITHSVKNQILISEIEKMYDTSVFGEQLAENMLYDLKSGCPV